MLRNFSLLDFKLGGRMMLKNPWLTIVGGLGMAVAVAIAASFFGVIYSMMDSKLPLPQGDRLIAIQLWERAGWYSPERRIASDYYAYRRKIKTVEELGIWRRVPRTIVTPIGTPRTVPVAEMTASGFRAAGVKPIKGRYFNDTDESKDSPLVAVIGYETWEQQFARDPRILSRTLQIGELTHRIIGVMPEGYHWPFNFDVWVPLRADSADFVPGRGPAYYMFGRLARGETLETAQAEVTRLGKEFSAAFPQTHAKLSPTLVPYAFPFFDIDTIKMTWGFHLLQLGVTLLLVVVCVNVATLMYARTATRQGEIAVRTALGAARSRIVAQLFIEALVLAAVACVVGITIANWTLQQIYNFMEAFVEGDLPFWLEMDVSLGVILYVAGLAFLSAAIVGAVPAMKVTGNRVQSKLRQLGGGSGLLLGKTWTFLIVAQVAFVVAVLPVTLHYAWRLANYGLSRPTFDSQRYLTARLGLEKATRPGADVDSISEASRQLFNERRAELMQRVRAEPGVAAATFAEAAPGGESTAFVMVEGVPLPNDTAEYRISAGSSRGFRVRPNRVDFAFFDAFRIPVVSGERFSPEAVPTMAVVNEAFVEKVLRGAPAVGRTLQYVGRSYDADSINVPLGVSFRIAGVVANFPKNELEASDATPRVYHPPAPGQRYRSLFIRLDGGDAEAFAPRLRTIAGQIDPALQIREARRLDRAHQQQVRMTRLAATGLAVLSLSVLLLSAAGIYALMSLAVSQRRREIGIRSALGAYPRNILISIFKRAVRQLVIGIAVGAIAALLLDRVTGGEFMHNQEFVLLPLVAAIMITVGLIAAWGPARRGLAIQPTEALRDV
jgi:putative ABC transport system permease protein